jgi:hypothetical protein
LPAATNPISVGYAALWNALTEFPAFKAPAGPIKPGPNTTINLQAPGFVAPKTAKDGDRPSVRIGEGKVAYMRQRNSKAVALAFGYPIQVASGQYGIDKIGLLNTIILQALDAAGVNLGNTSIYKWELGSGQSTPRDPLNSQTYWTTVLTVNVIFWIPNALFRNLTFT